MFLVNNLFIKYLDLFVLIFLDDILVYLKIDEEYERHLRKVLQLLRAH